MQKLDGRPPSGPARSPIYRVFGSCVDEERSECAGSGADDGEATYIDQDGNRLACKNVDALCAAVRLVQKYAAELGQSIWSEDVLKKAMEEVFSVFEDKFGASVHSSDDDDNTM